MPKVLVEVNYEIVGLNGTLYTLIPGIRKKMESEFIRCFNIYAHRVNESKIIANLNDEFDKLYPEYFEQNKGKDFRELFKYNGYMAQGLMDHVVDKMNNDCESKILEFSIDPSYGSLVGHLRSNKYHDITIRFDTKLIKG